MTRKSSCDLSKACHHRSGLLAAPRRSRNGELTPDQRRKLEAKRANESIRLSAGLLNNLAAGLFIGGLISPQANGRSLDVQWYVALVTVAGLLHLTGRLLLHTLKSED